MTAALPNPLLDLLNPSQREAVNHDNEHLLIIAGPGTGKTHTLIYRMSRWIGRLKSGQKLLAITFTNKAAKEIADRLREMLKDGDKRVTVGTFHRFSLELMSIYPEASGLQSDFQIVDEMALEEISKALWPRASRQARKDILNRISWQKSVDFEEPAFED